MTTKYGTIPTATTTTLPETWLTSDLGKRRPWKEMSSLSFPRSFKDSISRLKINISYFHMNYAIIIIFVLFLSLLWRPVSLIVFVLLTAAWFFLYFLREDPILIFGCEVDERVVLSVLTIATVVFVLTRATAGVLVGVSIGVAVALMHSVLSKIDDLILVVDGEQSPGGGGAIERVHLKETASSSFSSSSL
ncbi:hypothetical protein M9H77_24007 [Catharanthus roseus]|uniref:Uncharacterized protein n=1 Tax=Catharanthus roseus TaxID=4058 RepID=A0ACC0AVU6_CATRO|nr:hypothetical protein M9H77_24007 [Catharanthus roseus]